MEKGLAQIDWMLLVPELIILSTAALLSILDLLMDRKVSRQYFGIFSLIAIIWAGIYLVWNFGTFERMLEDTYLVDSFSTIVKLMILLGVFLVILLSLAKNSEDLQAYQGEYYYLLLIASLGGMVMVSSADFITLFVGLELLSISSYVLVGIRKKHLASAEAAWKYIVLGSVSSAFILYGMSFLYGLTGSTNLLVISNLIVSIMQSNYGLYMYLSLFLMIFGFGFKIASAPFHTWAPDVYQGAYTPITSFVAIVSKVAAFAFVMRILFIFVPLHQTDEWKLIIQPLLLVLSVLSMVVGNTVALRQTHAKRLMAYSGIAQIGYVLIPVATLGHFLMESTLYYLLAYLLMTMGAFAVIFLVTEEAKNDEISAFAGLYHRSPVLAVLMTIFLISLAGFPITAGFFGKFYILLNTIHNPDQLVWLAGVMIVTTIVSYFYYFRIIRQIYFRNPVNSTPLVIPWPIGFVVGIGFIGTVGLAVFPHWIVTLFSQVQWFG